MGVGLQLTAVPAGALEMQSAAAAVWDYLAGNAGAVALTAATAVFFLSGEAYHRAWAHGAPPKDALNRRGDLLSAIGALILGIALLSLGQVMLAATAGGLHALGKFGSAFRWRHAARMAFGVAQLLPHRSAGEPRPGDPRRADRARCPPCRRSRPARRSPAC